MRPRYWPLVVILLTDATVGTLIFYRWIGASYDGVMEAAYLGSGLLIVQLPLCIWGAIAARGAQMRPLFWIYVVHAIWTVGMYRAASIGLPRFFVPLKH